MTSYHFYVTCIKFYLKSYFLLRYQLTNFRIFYPAPFWSIYHKFLLYFLVIFLVLKRRDRIRRKHCVCVCLISRSDLNFRWNKNIIFWSEIVFVWLEMKFHKLFKNTHLNILLVRIVNLLIINWKIVRARGKTVKLFFVSHYNTNQISAHIHSHL